MPPPMLVRNEFSIEQFSTSFCQVPSALCDRHFGHKWTLSPASNEFRPDLAWRMFLQQSLLQVASPLCRDSWVFVVNTVNPAFCARVHALASPWHYVVTNTRPFQRTFFTTDRPFLDDLSRCLFHAPPIESGSLPSKVTHF